MLLNTRALNTVVLNAPSGELRQLAGASSIVVSTTATLTLNVNLVASAQEVTTVTSSASLTKNCSAASSCTVSFIALIINATKPLAASIDANVTVEPTLYIDKPISGSINCYATNSADIVKIDNLTSDINNSVLVEDAELVKQSIMNVDVINTATASAWLSYLKFIYSNADINVQTEVELFVEKLFSATIDSATTVTSNASLTKILLCQVLATVYTESQANIIKNIVAHADAVISVNAILDLQKTLFGSLEVFSSITSAQLAVNKLIASNITSNVSVANAIINIYKNMATSISSIVSTTSNIHLDKPIEAAVQVIVEIIDAHLHKIYTYAPPEVNEVVDYIEAVVEVSSITFEYEITDIEDEAITDATNVEYRLGTRRAA